ncbi:MAG: DUF5916 domain-containing protein [Myxococcota bacterium]|nr:DUF5916 domain-containing protein [Myxococcota bacterium]
MLPFALLGAALAGPPTDAASVARVAGGLRVDGVLEEPAWATAIPVDDFQRYRPSPAGPHDSRLEVRFLQDDTHLYVGVSVTEVDYEVRAHISPREDVNVDDQVGIYLDPMGEARTGYIFYVSALGVQQDIRYAYGDWFMSWNTVFQSEGRVTDDGYEIEIAIPFRSLRYPPVDGPGGAPVQDWGVMVTRKIPSDGTKYSWPRMQPRHPRMFAQQAKLMGVRPGPAGAGLELLPVLAGRFAADRGAEGTDPLAWTGLEPWSDSIRPGLDARVGLSEDMGLAATINPDFSQVEGDIRQIDLNQRFAFFYPERRPFFLDGLDSFRDTNRTLYTRSIVAPVGGVKVSGRTERLNIGALSALDRAPQASVHQDGTPGFDETALDGAWASDAFLRTRLDVMGNGFIGLTAADKRVVASPADGLSPTGARSDVLGADVQLPFGEVWTVGGYGSFSSAGTVDDTLVGGASGVEVDCSPAFGTGGAVEIYDVTPGYRNEMGFLTQSGISAGEGELFQRYRMRRDGYTGATGVMAEGWVERDQDQYQAVGATQDLTLTTNHRLEGQLLYRGWDFEGASVRGAQAELTYDALVNRFLGFDIGANVGRELDFGSLLPATATRFDGELNLRPSVSTRLDLFYAQQWFTPEGGSRAHLERFYGRLTWQLTRFLGTRIIGQTQTGTDIEDPAVQGSFLLTWLQNPGTEAYVGATWNVESDGRGLTEQMIFAKYSHLFRL